MRKKFLSIWQWARQNKAVLITLIILLGVDRLTKRLTLACLENKDVVLAPFLHLTYVQNTGAAFGMMQGGNLILIIVSLLILAYLLKSWQEFCAMGAWVKWGLVLILGGALGNLYDRITLGFVVDFIDLRVWPVFNAADSFITVGGVMLATALLFGKKATTQEEK
ncbi:MAG: signal peptidase II [Elusimicrobiaceae bacterium]|nr:signal peptidase II [Elusimicrobiaceae bacterium]